MSSLLSKKDKLYFIIFLAKETNFSNVLLCCNIDLFKVIIVYELTNEIEISKWDAKDGWSQ